MAEALNERELSRYVSRVSDRWPLERALLGGARAADARGALPQRERGPEYVIVLVSERFDGVPWLERVYQAGSLWDAHEIGVRPPGVKHLVHPEVGALELDCQTLLDPEQSHLLLVYTAVPGSETYEKLQLLSVIGTAVAGVVPSSSGSDRLSDR